MNQSHRSRCDLTAFALATCLVAASTAQAADDPPFKSKAAFDIPVAAVIDYPDAGEMVSVTGSVTGKFSAGYKGGPLNLKMSAQTSLTGTGMTSGDTYLLRGKGGVKMSSPTTVSEIELTISALVGDPIPGLDVKIGKNPGGGALVIHLDVSPTGSVSGGTATLNSLPTPSTATPVTFVQIVN